MRKGETPEEPRTQTQTQTLMWEKTSIHQIATNIDGLTKDVTICDDVTATWHTTNTPS